MQSPIEKQTKDINMNREILFWRTATKKSTDERVVLKHERNVPKSKSTTNEHSKFTYFPPPLQWVTHTYQQGNINVFLIMLKSTSIYVTASHKKECSGEGYWKVYWKIIFTFHLSINLHFIIWIIFQLLLSDSDNNISINQVEIWGKRNNLCYHRTII